MQSLASRLAWACICRMSQQRGRVGPDQPQARVIHSFGRADEAGLRARSNQLVKSINRVLDGDDGAVAGNHAPNIADIDIERVFELGVVLHHPHAIERVFIGIGPTDSCLRRTGQDVSAPHETALFVMAANPLERPVP